MKKMLPILLLLTSIPLTVFAGEVPNGPRPEFVEAFKKHHAHKMEMMAKELGLTADQKNKVDSIFEEQRVKLHAIHEETKTRLQAVLSSEQLKKYEDIHPLRHRMPPPKPE